MRLRVLFCVVLLFGSGKALRSQTQADIFDDTVLHEIRLSMKPELWQDLKDHYLDDAWHNVDTFQWQAGGKSASIGNVAIHSRGRGSRSPVKPSLNVGFDQNVKGQKFLGLTSLTLKAMTQDGSLMHERLTMSLFRRMAVPASREASARLYVNGESIGLYTIVEHVNQDLLTRLFNENNGYLFEYIPGDWTGVIGAGYHFEYLGQDLSKYASATDLTPFSPETHPNAPDTVTLESFIRTINQAPDAEFLAAMQPYLDLKSWLTHIAVETYVADFDCILGDAFGMNNFHIYRFENKQLFRFIAWDKDNAFDWNVRPIFYHADQNVLMKRLMSIAEYRHSYVESLLRVSMMAAGAGGWLEQESRRVYSQIHDAAYEDSNKTHLVSGILTPESNAEFDGFVGVVTAFPAIRTPFVLDAIRVDGYTRPGGNPALSPGGLLSAAGSAPASPGGIASLYGSNFGTADNTQVYINGYPAPVLFAAPGQLNVQVPWEVAGSPMVGAVVDGAPSNLITGTVETYAPGVFATAHLDGTPVTGASPAAAGEVLTVFATGLGPVNGGMVTGQPASVTTLQPTLTTPTVTIGGAPATVAFSGLAPGFIGLYQINLTVPSNISSGAQTQMTVGIGGRNASASLPVR